jgi:hypothetical protein
VLQQAALVATSYGIVVLYCTDAIARNGKRRNGYFAGLCDSLENPAIVYHVCARSVVSFWPVTV